eukprot:GFUD01031661.1.p1 GENE.GFUD01031661.1~~GFUD01031661.1.p1  ORF type:complete len:454 (+),score=128.28 GFUD01031661.1:266-1627(+)
MEENLPEGFVGVHIGAGQHSEARTNLYLEICAAACQAGTDVLRGGGSAVEAAARATIVLEDAGETNAGFGSNLTESGTVEMDAGLMDGSSLLFGAVGAISGVKNPILVARKLVEEQGKGLLPLGRVPPGFLVGEGAKEWAVRHNIQTIKTENLISDKAAKLYRHYKKKLDAYKLSMQAATIKRKREVGRGAGGREGGGNCLANIQNCKRLKQAADIIDVNDQVRSNDGATKLLDGNSTITSGDGCDDTCERLVDSERDSTSDTEDDHDIQDYDDGVGDTVGVVVLDRAGNVASTVSSGGIALKQPGRVGQASCFGCGCWAQKPIILGSNSTAVSTTGCGEHLVRTFLARECGEALAGSNQPLQELQRVMKERFAESEFLSGVPEKLGGAICMQYDKESCQGEFLWTHTTASMGIGFQSTCEEDATVKMSRLPHSAQQGTTILVEAVPFHTNPE